MREAPVPGAGASPVEPDGVESAATLPDRRGREPGSGDVGLAVYAGAAGLATAVPVPWLDSMLSGLARGAALRRVARRHGVRLTRDARDVLAAREDRGRRGSLPRRVVAAMVSRALAPVRIASRVEDAASTFAAAVLLDHHLRTATRPARAAVTAQEARHVRAAMESAEVSAVLEALRAAPGGMLRTLGAAARAAVDVDTEDRTPLERVSDGLLDAAADAPSELRARLCGAFDRAMGRTP